MIVKNIFGGLLILGGVSFLITGAISPLFDDNSDVIAVDEVKPVIVLASAPVNNLTPFKAPILEKPANIAAIDKYPVLRRRETCVVRGEGSSVIQSEYPFCDGKGRENEPVKTQLACNKCGAMK